MLVAAVEARGVNWHMDTGTRAKALRERLGLTQDQAAERGGLRRDEVTKVERGTNKASTSRIREGLARAYGVTLDQLAGYLEGSLSLASLPLPEMPPRESPQVERDDAHGALAAELWRVADRERHTLADVDAVRMILASEVDRQERRSLDLSDAARAWLDAAARLRRRGERVTAPALLVALLERSSADAERAAERATVANAEGDRKARELGVEPGSASGALKKALEKRH